MRAIASLAVVLGSIAVQAACTSSTDDRPATLSYIATAIIEPNCATSSCHSQLTRTSGIELDTRTAIYDALVGADGMGNLVVPGQPDRSMLMYLLHGDETWKMPPDEPLAEPDIDLIERWILDGAQDN